LQLGTATVATGRTHCLSAALKMLACTQYLSLKKTTKNVDLAGVSNIAESDPNL
jgi:hypothetical protein